MVAAFIFRKVGQAEERVTCSAQPQDNDEKISSDRVQPNMRKNLFNSHRCPRTGGFSSGGGELTPFLEVLLTSERLKALVGTWYWLRLR